MNLQQLTSGTPAAKPWLNIVAHDIVCRSITPIIPVPAGIPSEIRSADLSSSISCNDIGISGGGLDLIASQLDMNSALLRNPGLIDTSGATLNIITPTTQISQGLNAWDLSINSLPRLTQNSIKSKLECGTSRLQLAALSDLLSDDTSTYLAAQNVALTKNMAVAIAPDQLYVNQDYGAVNRLVVSDAQTALYSKNALIGPAGSLLELNDNNTFTLGCYFANNGIIECRPNSLALYGNAANSSYTLTSSSITTELSNGSGRITREIMDTSGQVWNDPTGAERLRISTGNVSIGGLYTLPTTSGVIGDVLTKNGFGGSVWQQPQIVGLYSATGAPITVANTTVQTSLIPSGVGSLTVPAGYFTPGMSFQLSCGGVFRDNVNNTQITFRLTNSGTLFSTGVLALSSVPLATTAWNIATQFTYTGGTQIITNFTFSYNSTNDARGFTSQQINNSFNAGVSNTLDFTVQWAVASLNNTITTNYFTLTKLY